MTIIENYLTDIEEQLKEEINPNCDAVNGKMWCRHCKAFINPNCDAVNLRNHWFRRHSEIECEKRAIWIVYAKCEGTTEYNCILLCEGHTKELENGKMWCRHCKNFPKFIRKIPI